MKPSPRYRVTVAPKKLARTTPSATLVNVPWHKSSVSHLVPRTVAAL
jgi:hypothetical protein